MDPIITESISFAYPDSWEKNNTKEYYLNLSREVQRKTVIFRRGAETFYFAIRFKRNFNRNTDVIRVRFVSGPKPDKEKGTKVVLKLDPAVTSFPKGKKNWAILINGAHENELVLQGYIPPTAPIGIWKCKIETNIKGIGARKDIYTYPENIYVIFNPWSKDDEVYLENQLELNEYIRNEYGIIWRGSYQNPAPKAWGFGQFGEHVLPASLSLLDRHGLDHSMRNSAVDVTRAIILTINLAKGVFGKDGNNVDALERLTGNYKQTDQAAKYGESCFYSGLVVTVFRSLGIPCRPVTNYGSAHDTNCSPTVNLYRDKDGRKLLDSDSCWPYYVWNEVWMKRRDIESGNYDGWQAIDGTPQENGANPYRCGPASVAAIRNGELSQPYDTRFFYSEVNAEVFIHTEDEDDLEFGFTPVKTSKYQIGRRIVTKSVNKDSYLDISVFYKNIEQPTPESVEEENDVLFDLVNIDSVLIGKPFDVTLLVENRSRELRTINYILVAESVNQSGSPVYEIRSERPERPLKLNPGLSKTLQISISPEEYIGKFLENGAINIFSTATVEETGQKWNELDDFTFTKPKVTVAALPTLHKGQETTAYFNFINPLPIPLTECSYKFEGPGVLIEKTHNDVAPGEKVEVPNSFFPDTEGATLIRATFFSRELHEIEGFAKVNVEPLK